MDHSSTTLVALFLDMTQLGGVVGLAQWSQTTLETSRHLKPQGQVLERLTWPLNNLSPVCSPDSLGFLSFCNEEAEGFGLRQATPASEKRSFVIWWPERLKENWLKKTGGFKKVDNIITCDLSKIEKLMFLYQKLLSDSDFETVLTEDKRGLSSTTHTVRKNGLVQLVLGEQKQRLRCGLENARDAARGFQNDVWSKFHVVCVDSELETSGVTLRGESVNTELFNPKFIPALSLVEGDVKIQRNKTDRR